MDGWFEAPGWKLYTAAPSGGSGGGGSGGGTGTTCTSCAPYTPSGCTSGCSTLPYCTECGTSANGGVSIPVSC